MKRDDIDLHGVLPQHLAIHARLENWRQWQQSGHGGSGVLPMFRYYRPDNWERQFQASVPVDVKDALTIQSAMVGLPEKHRHAIAWVYLRPYISLGKMCRELAVTRAGLALLVHDSRSMLKNRGTSNG